MFDFISDLIGSIFGGGDARTKRTRALRRKLVRYLKGAPTSAYLGSDAKYLGKNGEVTRGAQMQIFMVGKTFDAAGAQEWEALILAFLAALERKLPGAVVQLPPDEPRMVYAGDKQL